MKIFVTFGHGQFGGVFRNVYLEFEGDATEGEADIAVRQFMLQEFQGKWCGTYNEAEFAGQPEQYDLIRLCKFDLHGNVLSRLDPRSMSMLMRRMTPDCKCGNVRIDEAAVTAVAALRGE